MAFTAGGALGRPFSTTPSRALLATFTASDICQEPQEVAITIANSFVQGSGLTVAEAEVRQLLNFEYNTSFLLATWSADISFSSVFCLT